MLNEGIGGEIGIGVAENDYFKQRAMPGWKSGSKGYHGDGETSLGDGKNKIDSPIHSLTDGKLFLESEKGVEWGAPLFHKGDVVGCGIDHKRNTLFFTVMSPNKPSPGHTLRFFGIAIDNFEVSSKAMDVMRRLPFFLLFLQLTGRDLYPVVGFGSHGASVAVNFGDEPFQFDIVKHMEEGTSCVTHHAL